MPYNAIPIPINNLKSLFIIPVIKQYALGTAKIKKKASFFSKNPGCGW
jgi:hypothetical protein